MLIKNCSSLLTGILASNRLQAQIDDDLIDKYVCRHDRRNES